MTRPPRYFDDTSGRFRPVAEAPDGRVLYYAPEDQDWFERWIVLYPNGVFGSRKVEKPRGKWRRLP